MTVYNMEINQDILCKRCGKGGAVKTQNMDEFGDCLECATKDIIELGQIGGLNMFKTIEQIKCEVGNLLDNYRDNITSAYEKSGGSLKVDIKIGMERLGQDNTITPSLEFYPLPKTKSEKYTIKINEKQLSIAGMS